MSIRPYRQILRRKCRQIMVGKVPVGGDAPITVQTMTNTLTSDVDATVAQIRAAEAAGADIVRVSCPDEESTAGHAKIIPQVSVPIVASSANCSTNTASRAPKRWSKVRSTTPNISKTKISANSRSAAKPRTCSWP